MGDGFGDGEVSERPLHEVCVNDFRMGKYEVTQGQWKAVMGSNPSFFKDCGDDCPVENVSWNGIQVFLDILSRKTGRKYRLPTEAEWEYAAKSGGKNEKWSGTSADAELGGCAWYYRNSEKKTHPVGRKNANSLGLYDMSGNVWEWVEDRFSGRYYRESPKENPQGPEGGLSHVVRGGSWSGFAEYVRTTDRMQYEPNHCSSSGGFRCVLSE